jgi:hypothetical protein
MSTNEQQSAHQPEKQQRITEVRITSDAAKLWTCTAFALTHAQHYGKVSLDAGEKLRILLPPVSPSPFCDARYAWKVLEDDAMAISGQENRMVCEHQIDID